MLRRQSAFSFGSCCRPFLSATGTAPWVAPRPPPPLRLTMCCFSTTPTTRKRPLSFGRRSRSQRSEKAETEAQSSEDASRRPSSDLSAAAEQPTSSAEEPLRMTVPTRPRRTDMPRYLCHRWYLPGFGDLAVGDTVPDERREEDSATSSGSGGDRAVEQEVEDRRNDGDAPIENDTTEAAAAAGATPEAKGEEAEDAGDGLEQDRDYADTEKEVGDEETTDASRESPSSINAFQTYQAEKNKEIKRILMASLGNEFARAGIHTDGVRTNFSAMSYQVVKQVTGLPRIPSKLLLSCLVSPDRSIEWIDVSAHPTATLTEYKEAVQEVLAGLGMHQTVIEDSAQPMLLPQVTVTKDVYAFVMRYAIRPPTNKQQDSLQDLTNRFTVFLGSNRIVTVHRTQCTFVEELKQDWQQIFQEEKRSQRFLLYYFVKEIAHTFSSAISTCIVEFDAYEAGLFSSSRNRSKLAREIYHIKRRASAYGRTLTLTQDAYSHVASSLKIYTSDVLYQEIQHDLAHVQSLAEELNANADSVLQLLFQLSSYQVNELMRVLTLFSAFFIPLSFIASVYGMNFEGLPFLQSPHGELYCGLMMMFVAAVIFVWFKQKNFM